MFSALADLVHHVRNQLEFAKLQGAVELFARCLHDPSLPGYVQAMCGKLMLNLVECIIKAAAESPPPPTRQLLLYMLQVSFLQLHTCLGNADGSPRSLCGSSKSSATSACRPSWPNTLFPAPSPQPTRAPALRPSRFVLRLTSERLEDGSSRSEQRRGEPGGDAEEGGGGGGRREGSPARPARNPAQALRLRLHQRSRGNVRHGLQRYRSPSSSALTGSALQQSESFAGLVRVLVCGAKTLSWGLNSARKAGGGGGGGEAGLEAGEARLFLRLLDHGLPALSIYTVVANQAQPNTFVRAQPTSTIRAKDEKETLEHFGSVVSPQRLIGSERIHGAFSLSSGCCRPRC